MDDPLADGATGGSMAGGESNVTALLARGAEAGSGGTGLDLALANYWTGSKKKIHGVRAWGDSDYFYPHAEHSLAEAGITGINPRDIIDIIGKPSYYLYRI